MARAVLVVVLALVLPSLPALGLDIPLTRETLKGLPGVHVTVTVLFGDEKPMGFDERTFQTDAELKLRKAGIKVLSGEEWASTDAMPSLQINVLVLANDPGGVATYAIIVLELYQRVFLRRDTSALVFGDTWSVLTVGPGDAPVVYNRAKGTVDTFINAWLSVNPKE